MQVWRILDPFFIFWLEWLRRNHFVKTKFSKPVTSFFKLDSYLSPQGAITASSKSDVPAWLAHHSGSLVFLHTSHFSQEFTLSVFVAHSSCSFNVFLGRNVTRRRGRRRLLRTWRTDSAAATRLTMPQWPYIWWIIMIRYFTNSNASFCKNQNQN